MKKSLEVYKSVTAKSTMSGIVADFVGKDEHLLNVALNMFAGIMDIEDDITRSQMLDIFRSWCEEHHIDMISDDDCRDYQWFDLVEEPNYTVLCAHGSACIVEAPFREIKGRW